MNGRVVSKKIPKKMVVGLVFGGKSSEHEVSVLSAKTIKENLNERKYAVVEVFVDRRGKFDRELLGKVDIVFPIVHGNGGEDGCLQGYLETINMPYVGAGVMGSALGMDKEVQKRLLERGGVEVAKWQVVRREEEVVVDRFPVFVKPANSGSSVGVTKVEKRVELAKAIKKAGEFDRKILVEEAVEGREMEVGVLGNDEVVATGAGEIIPVGHDFYDYEAKYVDENGAMIRIPMEGVNEVKREEIKKVAIQTYKLLEVDGMARVDMFLKPDGRIVVNEINTLPGFTRISMYPKLWEWEGVKISELLDRLIELGWKRWRRRNELRRRV